MSASRPKVSRKACASRTARDARLHVVGVHVDDRHVEALRGVRRVARGAALVRVGREAELVVRDQVDRAAGGVAGQRLEVERLGDDALAGEGGVAVDQHRHDGGGVVRYLARLARRLVGARPALDHRVHVLEVARVRRQRDRHAAARVRRVGAARAVVVLHVAGAALGRRGLDGDRLLALELGEDRGVRAPDVWASTFEPAAVRHAEHDLARPARRRPARSSRRASARPRRAPRSRTASCPRKALWR